MSACSTFALVGRLVDGEELQGVRILGRLLHQLGVTSGEQSLKVARRHPNPVV